MTSEVMAQGSQYQEVRMWTCFFFYCNFPTDFSLFFSSYFHFCCAFISYFLFDLACSLRQAGLLKKDKVKVDFQNSIFVSPAKQKRDICIAFPALSSAAA